jgi:Tfp pilus assembly protein PilF
VDRKALLKQQLAQHPDDKLARYGLAMEYANAGEVDIALEHFRKLLATDPNYANAYFMAAQALAKAGRTREAQEQLERGIVVAQRTGNRHAQSEMQAMLDEMMSA